MTLHIRLPHLFAVATLGLVLTFPANAQDKPGSPARNTAAKVYPRATTPMDLFKYVKEATVAGDATGLIHYMSNDARAFLEKAMTSAQEQFKSPPTGVDVNAMSMMMFGIPAAEASKLAPLDLFALSMSKSPDFERVKKVELRKVEYGEDGKGDPATAAVATIATTEEDLSMDAVKENGEWRLAM